ncbi:MULTISPECIES: TetR/AcrR family transcriptional regulator [unclassified Bradyrhizobium]|uniref:TetR/AcrR family transcriptional regulator n=1 Tax=unclassified Bradyrhizobium TaxID=2631580 RepID=UPI002342A492|nr:MULTISPECIES: TetR/AcrR family transcriptional regulator [unclassified Bradyrhizobium]GLH87695.1 TetR family transcriptional regulator [Bradyrhizobium sp. SSBR45R]
MQVWSCGQRSEQNMRVSREKAAQNREQIIETAARLLRQRGFDGIGVADIMKAAGLTHGGFYRNFASKDDLAVKAGERVIAETMALLKAGLAEQPPDPLRALVERYVSTAHRDNPGSGCILPALAADAARSDDPALRAVFTKAIQLYLDQIAKLSSASPRCTGGRHPAAILSEMVGAVMLSRVIADAPLAEALMAAVVADIAGPSPEKKSAEQ